MSSNTRYITGINIGSTVINNIKLVYLLNGKKIIHQTMIPIEGYDPFIEEFTLETPKEDSKISDIPETKAITEVPVLSEVPVLPEVPESSKEIIEDTIKENI